MPWDSLRTARILIVDDDEDNLILLRHDLLKAGVPHIELLSDPNEMVSVYNRFRPDLVILDYWLPPTDALHLLAELREAVGEGIDTPVIILSGDLSQEAKVRTLRANVSDFLNKDFDTTELILRVRNALQRASLMREVAQQRNSLEIAVSIRSQELRAAQREVLERLAAACEYRDDSTGEHTRRVGRLSARIARALGFSEDFVESIRLAALLHDLGKIGIPDQILRKPGRLDPEEFEVMKQHTIIGSRILEGCAEPVLKMAREIALSHHERWSGEGYPYGLSGDQIPVSGRIVAVADAFDAMTSVRPYQRPKTVGEAIVEMEVGAGRQFDPEISRACIRVADQLEPSNHNGHAAEVRVLQGRLDLGI